MQFGVGVPSGCVQANRLISGQLCLPGSIVMTFDAISAFILITRRCIQDALIAYEAYDSCVSLFAFLYGALVFILFVSLFALGGVKVVRQLDGTAQGFLFASIFYAIGSDDLYRDANTKKAVMTAIVADVAVAGDAEIS